MRRPHSVSVDAAAMRRKLPFDSFSLGKVVQTETLTAICLLIIAACALGFMLYFLREILLPFAVAVFLMYLLQPMVNYLAKPPRRWCDKCCHRRGEECCQSLWSITRSRLMTEESQNLREPDGLGFGGGAGGRGGGSGRRRIFMSCLDYPIIPRWVAVLLAISFALGAMVVLGVIVYTSFTHLEADFPKYEQGAQEMAEHIKKTLQRYGYSMDEDVVPFIVAKTRAMVPRALAFLVNAALQSVYVIIFLVYLLISPRRPVASGVWGQIDLHIRRYIRLKTAICLGVGVSVGVILWGLHVQLAWVFGLI
ncbi:unnamed protein product, partial [Phaeothamnion confervicola]